MSGLSANGCRRLTAGLIVITFLVIALGGIIRIYDAVSPAPIGPLASELWDSMYLRLSKKLGMRLIQMK